ncbi:hypothetical protein [Cellulomonas sp.]|uniref:hypothetical protein n=1 Tax=Cellulomonas sp. TaxID=40001 RepID=UPI002810F6AA|nr:hypothetical protein [Cellulomonas sp.]
MNHFLREVARAAHTDTFEVSELFVGEPVEGSAADLRNGSLVSLEDALELVRRMRVGHGPYCVLKAAEMSVQCSWDGAVFLTLDSMTPLPELDLWPHLSISSREVPPAVHTEESFVTAVADEAFWSSVASAPGRVKLLRERWAYGKFGSRWHDISDCALPRQRPPVDPRSLLSVVLDPQLDPDHVRLDSAFTAIRELGGSGELVHEEFPFGIEAVADFRRDGWRFAVSESEAWRWMAVVPDRDGEVRACWGLADA